MEKIGKICMNEACNATTTDWKKGWNFKSGGFATLCYSCGSVYENSLYCETFHLDESGWRECRLCGKRVHCGCVVSKDMYEHVDRGGIGCIGCSNKMENQPLRPLKAPYGEVPNGFGPRSRINVSDPQLSMVVNQKDGFKCDDGMLIQIDKVMIENEKLIQLSKTTVESDTPTGQIRPEGAMAFVRPSIIAKHDSARPGQEANRFVSAAHSALNFSLATNFHTPNFIEEKDLSRVPSFPQGESVGQILTMLSKSDSDANKATTTEPRVPRPPVEGRGRHQLLPRYWPRITDQELQQISGELNSTIVPLFEKVLSASDAGRIGRLVLPKACAEAYFPPISQSEGVAIKIQDVKGKEWKFQFRFWPNNNSRMYVLEGVTPCIQNMQLQAGDTVTFSRIDPGGTLVIGFRKSSIPGDMQDCQTSAPPNGTGSGEASLPAANDNLPTNGGGTNEGIQRNLIPGKKKTRNIGSKSKRLHMNIDDAMELRLTWDEAQELLRPPPSAKPNIIMIEDHVFEEYDEPPVFGKRTIFTAGATGNQEQWAQCDSCLKWRRIPVDFLVPTKWTCVENIWDSSRCSCSAIGEMNPVELERFLRAGRESKIRKVTESPSSEPEHEASGLDALATAAFLGENMEGPGEPSTGPTTKHPRHRPGCTCIVCIQPPSGKGRHKPTCICNVCLTVKRRFKTLMLRKKKRQAECEMELALEKEKMKNLPSMEDPVTNGTTGNGFLFKCSMEDERNQSKTSVLDLNCHPNREEDDLNCHPNREVDVLEEGTSVAMCRKENGITRPSTSNGHPPEEQLQKSEKCVIYKL